MLNNVKKFVFSNINKSFRFRFNGNRNQSEEFLGKIIGVYPSIFIIELDNKIIKSFSYSDLLIKNLEIIEC